MKKSKFVLFRVQSDKVEVGVEVKDTMERISDFIGPHEMFFSDVESRFCCSVKSMKVDGNDMIFVVENLDSSYYTGLLFMVKNKLDTTFETARLYFKVI